MNIVRLIRTIFFYSVLIISFFLGIFLTILASFFYPPRERFKRYQKSAHTWARFLAFISGIPVKVAGLENIPKDEPLIIASNHQGAADILILLAYLPIPFSFVIKKELFSIPIFGWYLRQAGYVFLERGTSKGAVNMFSEAVRQLRAHGNILIFPEGTRSPDGRLQPFKRGSLLLAFKAKVRVLPVAISGSFNILQKKGWIFDAVPVNMKIGKPISIDKYHNDSELASGGLHSIIEQMLEA